MVIKIMGKNNDEWFLIDGVGMIEVNHYPKEEVDGKTEEHSKTEGRIRSEGVVLIREEVVPVTRKVLVISMDPQRPDKGYTTICFEKDGESCLVQFNTAAFICSDTGKTFERIYG